MDIKNKFKHILPLSIFLIIFYVADALRFYFVHSTNFLIDRMFTWVIPIFLFIIFVLRKNPLDYLKLRREVKRGIFWGIIISIIHIFLYCSLRYLWNHQLTVNFDLSLKRYWDEILTVGFVEEVMFRGLVLQNLNSVFSFKTSNIVSAALFVLAHLPYWYFGNQFSLPILNIVYDFFFLFAFGLFWGFLVKKTNSLWPSMIHHSVNNALAIMVK
jgi:membrane protease YdiL (CAAX protease family)